MSASVDIMGVLDLILDVAYHDGTPRDLAIAAEAWSLAGYHDGSIMVSHASNDEILARVQGARKGRHRRVLTAEARGLLRAVSVLCDEGLANYATASRRDNERWQERGGHDFTDYA